MKGIYAVFRKEMSQYFVSSIAYVAVGAYLFLAGIFFQGILKDVTDYAMRGMIQAMQFGQPFEIDVPGEVMRGFFGVTGTILLFVVPMLTMGSYAEERRRGTMELLMTSPITDLEIVLGKYLAVLTLFVIMVLPSTIQMVVLFRASEPTPPWRLVLCGYLGVILLGGSLLALGQFISSLTESQIVAGIWTFLVFLMLWVLDFIIPGSSSSWAGAVAQYVSILRHMTDFTRGIVDSSNLIYYASLILLGLFLTHRSVDSMRWRAA
ncbi:MAG TPA: ABC transporter permease [Candidatus Acidoferrales bacterium]|nr:ABC transporter permease [Candidatus Acidoferrales bacterium]